MRIEAIESFDKMGRTAAGFGRIAVVNGMQAFERALLGRIGGLLDGARPRW
jgi:hypothetical protein